MPVTPSAAKALRNSEAKRARNTLAKAELKRQLKNVTVETLSKVVSLVDKNAKRNLIHENKAARLKSQLSKRFAGGEDIASAPVKKKRAGAKKTSAKVTAARKTAKARAATAKKK